MAGRRMADHAQAWLAARLPELVDARVAIPASASVQALGSSKSVPQLRWVGTNGSIQAMRVVEMQMKEMRQAAR